MLLTVEYILIHCVDFALARAKYYNAASLKQLFDKVDPRKVVNFLREINLYHKF